MLILTRRLGETIMIGDEVTVTILRVRGNQVRVGINAPRRVAVHREEVYQRIHAEKLASVSQAGSGKLSLAARAALEADHCGLQSAIVTS